MRLINFSLFLLYSSVALSQLFVNEDNVWHQAERYTFPVTYDPEYYTYYFHGDIVIENKVYKILNRADSMSIYTAQMKYFREDNGVVYYHSGPYGEFKYFDTNVQVGDTTQLGPLEWSKCIVNSVDSILTDQGTRKTIVYNFPPTNKNFTYIEGIGNVTGGVFRGSFWVFDYKSELVCMKANIDTLYNSMEYDCNFHQVNRVPLNQKWAYCKGGDTLLYTLSDTLYSLYEYNKIIRLNPQQVDIGYVNNSFGIYISNTLGRGDFILESHRKVGYSYALNGTEYKITNIDTVLGLDNKTRQKQTIELVSDPTLTYDIVEGIGVVSGYTAHPFTLNQEEQQFLAYYINDELVYKNEDIDCQTSPSEQISDKHWPNIYPNPAEKTINIEHHKALRQVILLSLDGSRTHFLTGNYGVFDLSDIPQGLYFLKMTTHDSEVTVSRLVKL